MPTSSYTERRVKHSENYVRSNLRGDITPIKNNVVNHLDVDIITDLGTVDVQYTSSDSLFVDFISVLNHTESCVLPGGKRDHPKFMLAQTSTRTSQFLRCLLHFEVVVKRNPVMRVSRPESSKNATLGTSRSWRKMIFTGTL